jgi:hypothetical protein
MSHQQFSLISAKSANLASLSLSIMSVIFTTAISQIITTSSAWAQSNSNVAQTSESSRITRAHDLLPLQPASVLGGTVNAKCSFDIISMGIILPDCGAGDESFMSDRRQFYKQVERNIYVIPGYQANTEAPNDRILIHIPL